MDDGKEFSVVNVVVLFRWGKGLGEVGTRMPFAVRVGLEKNGTGGIFGGVGGNGEGCREVGEMEDRF